RERSRRRSVEETARPSRRTARTRRFTVVTLRVELQRGVELFDQRFILRCHPQSVEELVAQRREGQGVDQCGGRDTVALCGRSFERECFFDQLVNPDVERGLLRT